MIEKKDIIVAIKKVFKEVDEFKKLKFKKLSSNEEVGCYFSDDIVDYTIEFSLQHRFPEYHLDQLNEKIYVKPFESFINPILDTYDIEVFEDDYTLINPSANKELYMKIVSTPVKDEVSLKELCRLLHTYLTTDTLPFFKEKITYKGMYQQINNKKIPDLIECGIGALYPASIFKAMVIAYRAGDQKMFNEIKEELTERYNKDKDDPDTAYMYGDFREALKELTEKLAYDF